MVVSRVLVIGAVLGASFAPRSGPDDAAAAAADVITYDIELADALVNSGLLDEWYAAAPVEPELALVEVSLTTPSVARGQFFAGLAEKAEVTAKVEGLEAHLAEQRAHLAVVRAALPERAAQLATSTLQRSTVMVAEETTTVRLDTLEATIRDAAVAMYIDGGQGVTGLDFDTDAYNASANSAELVTSANDALFGQRSDVLDALADLAAERARLDAEIDELTDQLDALELDEARTQSELEIAVAARFSLEQRLADLAVELPAYLPTMHEERMTGTIPMVGLPFALVNAYVRGARIGREIQVGCQIPWPVLAGIAAVESGHGTYGGAVVQPDGTVVPAILGPMLDGSLAGNAVITDTDGGALDGNAQFDRAVGPFQFIPATWNAFAVDATGDGRADPQNLADAGATAGNYLCAITPMLNDDDIRRSIFGYNHSDAYVNAVLGRAAPFFAMHLGEVPPQYAPPPQTLALTGED